MAKLNCEIDLYEFNDIVGFWAGAKDRWEDMTDEEKDYLNESAADREFDTLTAINDFVWFESDDILDEIRAEDENEEDEDD